MQISESSRTLIGLATGTGLYVWLVQPMLYDSVTLTRWDSAYLLALMAAILVIRDCGVAALDRWLADDEPPSGAPH